MNKKANVLKISLIVLIVLLVILLVGLILHNFLYVITTGSETITIKEKWEKYHEGDEKYLVSSINGQVFQITDTYTKWRFDSSNLYAELEEGMTCDIKTQGFRFPFFSDYKNIIEADC